MGPPQWHDDGAIGVPSSVLTATVKTQARLAEDVWVLMDPSGR